jgi:hypothetical protein
MARPVRSPSKDGSVSVQRAAWLRRRELFLHAIVRPFHFNDATFFFQRWQTWTHPHINDGSQSNWLHSLLGHRIQLQSFSLGSGYILNAGVVTSVFVS